MFITFEGINGSGKSTQAKMLYDFLVSKHKDVVLTKEPGGGGEFCMELRKLICQTKDISKIAEILILFAARKEHLDKLILPSLNEGKIVICDRYIDSTFAYQCCDDDAEKYDLVNYIFKKTNCLVPDKTFFIDISVEESEYRLAPLLYSYENINNNGYKKFDELKSEHMQKILDTYHYLAKQNINRIKTINGLKTKEEIHQQIIKELGF